MTKICTKCKEEKDLFEFHKDTQKKDGLGSSCKKCKAFWHEKNKETQNKKSAKYHEQHREDLNKKQNERAKLPKNREKQNEWHSKPENRIKINLRRNERRRQNALCRLRSRIRSLINHSIKNKGFAKTSKTHEILGCTFEEFKVYIENQFIDDMSWDNYPEWEYDHIYPVSLAENEEHLIALNHYTNFQPLWRIDNKLKSNKLPEELI